MRSVKRSYSAMEPKSFPSIKPISHPPLYIKRKEEREKSASGFKKFSDSASSSDNLRFQLSALLSYDGQRQNTFLYQGSGLDQGSLEAGYITPRISSPVPPSPPVTVKKIYPPSQILEQLTGRKQAQIKISPVIQTKKEETKKEKIDSFEKRTSSILDVIETDDSLKEVVTDHSRMLKEQKIWSKLSVSFRNGNYEIDPAISSYSRSALNNFVKGANVLSTCLTSTPHDLTTLSSTALSSVSIQVKTQSVKDYRETVQLALALDIFNAHMTNSFFWVLLLKSCWMFVFLFRYLSYCDKQTIDEMRKRNLLEPNGIKLRIAGFIYNGMHFCGVPSLLRLAVRANAHGHAQWQMEFLIKKHNGSFRDLLKHRRDTTVFISAVRRLRRLVPFVVDEGSFRHHEDYLREGKMLIQFFTSQILGLFFFESGQPDSDSFIFGTIPKTEGDFDDGRILAIAEMIRLCGSVLWMSHSGSSMRSLMTNTYDENRVVMSRGILLNMIISLTKSIVHMHSILRRDFILFITDVLFLCRYYRLPLESDFVVTLAKSFEEILNIFVSEIRDLEVNKNYSAVNLKSVLRDSAERVFILKEIVPQMISQDISIPQPPKKMDSGDKDKDKDRDKDRDKDKDKDKISSDDFEQIETALLTLSTVCIMDRTIWSSPNEQHKNLEGEDERMKSYELLAQLSNKFRKTKYEQNIDSSRNLAVSDPRDSSGRVFLQNAFSIRMLQERFSECNFVNLSEGERYQKDYELDLSDREEEFILDNKIKEVEKEKRKELNMILKKDEEDKWMNILRCSSEMTGSNYPCWRNGCNKILTEKTLGSDVNNKLFIDSFIECPKCRIASYCCSDCLSYDKRLHFRYCKLMVRVPHFLGFSLSVENTFEDEQNTSHMFEKFPYLDKRDEYKEEKKK